MFELTIFIFSVVTCVIIAIIVWVTVKSNTKTGPANSESNNRLDDHVGIRRTMHFVDWVYTFVLVIVGVYLGVAIDYLMQLFSTAFWPVAVIIPLLFVGVLLFAELFDGIVDRFFPSGVRPARKPQMTKRIPFPRLLSLPVGIIIGITLVRLGFGDTILRLTS